MQYDPFTIKIREYLESEIIKLDSTGGLSKIGSLNSEDLNYYLINLYDYPELENIVLKNDDDSYDLFLRYRSKDEKIDIGSIITSAYNDYIKDNQKRCTKKLLLVLRKAAFPKSDVYAVLGLSYEAMGKYTEANDYLRVSNYLLQEKDYNNVNIEKVRERVENNMKKGKNNIYNQMNYDSERQVHIDKLSISNFDEIIEYMENHQIDIETAGKELGLTNEQIDIVKLIFAREFYKQGDMKKGNFYLNSVEKASGKTSEITRLCLEARTNKRFFQYRDNNEPKKLSLVKPGRRK